MSLKKNNDCKNMENKDNEHSFEWELIKTLISYNKRLVLIVCISLLLWFFTIIFLIK